MADRFRKFAHFVSRMAGTAGAFVLAFVVVAIWAITGPVFGFSDTWQLVINTGTTIVTFLMVFLIQNTQNRDSQALHAKLDDLLIAVRDADNQLVDAEELSDEELKRIKEQLRQMAKANGGATGTEDEAPKRETATSSRGQSASA
jgi:low affinity Fe/Cu permease